MSEPRLRWLWAWLVILASLPIKMMAAHNMPFDIDIVPVVSRNVAYLLTPVGTLSSVAAYNMPMLEWLHLPAQWITGDVWWTILLTLMGFNIAAMLAVYGLARDLFDWRVGLLALTLFAFSEVGVSSAYTAWAQLLLPGFFVMTVYCLWQWRIRENGLWLALAGIVATAAFMTHFAAVLLYPAMLAFALLTGAKWQWRGLLGGALVVALLMTPYMLVQVERDFRDVRAFLSQEPLVAPEVMAAIEVYKPGYSAPQDAPKDTDRPQARRDDAPPPRWQRALLYIANAPAATVKGLNATFSPRFSGLEQAAPALTPLWFALSRMTQGLFWGALALATWDGLRAARQGGLPRSIGAWQAAFVHTRAGRIALLMAFMLVIVACLLLTRTIDNSTYMTGFLSLQVIVAGAIFAYLPEKRSTWLALIALMIVVGGLHTADRGLRVLQHDDAAFSPFNVALYRHIEATADHIAGAWQSDDDPIIAYDVLPETPFFWWVLGWHTIDPHYTLGMAFDFLLAYDHGITNANTDPSGAADDPDFIVIYEPALARYDLTQYEQSRFGAIVVLQAR